MSLRLFKALHNARPGDEVVRPRSPRAWELVTAFAGWTLILLGVATVGAFAWTMVVLVFSLGLK